MKYEFIRVHRSAFAVEKMCRVLEVSRSGYYRSRDESQRSLENKVILKAIKDVYDKSRGTYCK